MNLTIGLKKLSSIAPILLAALFLSINTQSVVGQSITEMVEVQFEESELKNIRYFRGRLNDINEIVIALGDNGSEYKGVLQYMRSKEIFLLEGKMDFDKLKLIEKDTSQNVTGYITGEINDFLGITGEWYNYNRMIGADIRLLPYQNEPKYPTYCGDNKWVRVYKGFIEEEEVELFLKRGGHNKIRGLIWFANENKSYFAEGYMDNGTRIINLHFRDENWKSKGSIEGNVSFYNDDIEGTYTLDTAKSTYSLYVDKTLSVGCIEYSNYISILEVLYPKTRNLAFNETLKSKIDDWVALSKAYVNDYQSQFPALTPTQRHSLRSYFWYDISYISDDLMSLVGTFSNTWEKEANKFVYNFDLKNDKEILLEDLFLENSDYKNTIYTYIREDIRNRPYYTDPTFQQWILGVEFEYFTIRKDGLHFSTPFHGIFGEQHCTIPYTTLLPYLKKDSPISSLIGEE